MDTSAYNHYVLDASLQAGWITGDQQQTVQAALDRIPGASALDFLVEQELLNSEQYDQLKALIVEAMEAQVAESGPAPEDAVSAALHAEVQKEEVHVHEFLKIAVESGASDLHLGPDAPPMMRHNGLLRPISDQYGLLSPEHSEALAKEFLTQEQIDVVEESGAYDFCYEHESFGRFRTCVVRQRRGWESVFRVISDNLRSMEELGLPPVMYDLIKYHNGLILVTGAVGSGKTTTLAALVDQINKDRLDHIITLEEPIEYVFNPSGCQVTQREIRTHTESFAAALRGSLRQDPDIIMVGEMRDLETISLAITASETGHLVLGSLHTANASRTMQRLLDVFPVNQQAQIRTMVSESIRGVVCQQLVPRADGAGRVLALEIMTNTPAIANLIREGDNHLLPGVMQTGRNKGMRLMDDSLMELYEANIISSDEAYSRSQNKKLFAAAMAAQGIH
ncbi:MAG: PilT/PilU family type 4a pilus ATPase [Verrucomicrobiota bacterium]